MHVCACTDVPTCTCCVGAGCKRQHVDMHAHETTALALLVTCWFHPHRRLCNSACKCKCNGNPVPRKRVIVDSHKHCHHGVATPFCRLLRQHSSNKPYSIGSQGQRRGHGPSLELPGFTRGRFVCCSSERGCEARARGERKPAREWAQLAGSGVVPASMTNPHNNAAFEERPEGRAVLRE